MSFRGSFNDSSNCVGVDHGTLSIYTARLAVANLDIPCITDVLQFYQES
jgi:hypothetical protein